MKLNLAICVVISFWVCGMAFAFENLFIERCYEKSLLLIELAIFFLESFYFS